MTPEIRGELHSLIHKMMNVPERGETTLETIRNAIGTLAKIVLDLEEEKEG